jgi:serine/threonine-protein kinase PRP4
MDKDITEDDELSLLLLSDEERQERAAQHKRQRQARLDRLARLAALDEGANTQHKQASVSRNDPANPPNVNGQTMQGTLDETLQVPYPQRLDTSVSSAQKQDSINKSESITNNGDKKRIPVTVAQTYGDSKDAPKKMNDTSDKQAQATRDDDDDDIFDMFSSSVSPIATTTTRALTTEASTVRGHAQEDWDDAEGYYKAVIGEEITLTPFPSRNDTSNAAKKQGNNSSSTADAATSSIIPSQVTFRVAGVIGKGVFSTVLQCSTISNTTSIPVPPTVAIKCIRHNDAMAKAAHQEIRILQRLSSASGIVQLWLPMSPNQNGQGTSSGNNKSSNNKRTASSTDSVLSVAPPLIHRGHVVLVFTFYEYNLRDVLKKFGNGGLGLSLPAVRSYFAQLLSAATHLQKHGIIHADLKLDNILVSSDFSAVHLADFGSAMDVNAPELLVPTPYLVSRFYRAPEVILGLNPTFAVDLWSLAVTVAELYLGEVVFRGKSNNDMVSRCCSYAALFAFVVLLSMSGAT